MAKQNKGTNTINFGAPQDEIRIVAQIASRAHDMAKCFGVEYTLQDATMDIIATHMNGHPLRLMELANADNINFSHDVFGIRRHLNRQTGKLDDFFVPRYSK
jgi:hypothetical protein